MSEDKELSPIEIEQQELDAILKSPGPVRISPKNEKNASEIALRRRIIELMDENQRLRTTLEEYDIDPDEEPDELRTAVRNMASTMVDMMLDIAQIEAQSIEWEYEDGDDE